MKRELLRPKRHFQCWWEANRGIYYIEGLDAKQHDAIERAAFKAFTAGRVYERRVAK